MTIELPDTHSSNPAPEPLALKSNEGLGPNAQLVERLRARRGFLSTDGFRWYVTSEPDSDCQDAATEIESLRGERDVLVSVLRECDEVIRTMEPESSDEGDMLNTLLASIKRVMLLRQADERDLLSALGPNVPMSEGAPPCKP